MTTSASPDNSRDHRPNENRSISCFWVIIFSGFVLFLGSGIVGSLLLFQKTLTLRFIVPDGFLGALVIVHDENGVQLKRGPDGAVEIRFPSGVQILGGTANRPCNQKILRQLILGGRPVRHCDTVAIR